MTKIELERELTAFKSANGRLRAQGERQGTEILKQADIIADYVRDSKKYEAQMIKQELQNLRLIADLSSSLLKASGMLNELKGKESG